MALTAGNSSGAAAQTTTTAADGDLVYPPAAGQNTPAQEIAFSVGAASAVGMQFQCANIHGSEWSKVYAAGEKVSYFRSNLAGRGGLGTIRARVATAGTGTLDWDILSK